MNTTSIPIIVSGIAIGISGGIVLVANPSSLVGFLVIALGCCISTLGGAALLSRRLDGGGASSSQFPGVRGMSTNAIAVFCVCVCLAIAAVGYRSYTKDKMEAERLAVSIQQLDALGDAISAYTANQSTLK